MSNGKGKDALFDQISKTMELVREGKRTVEEASRVFQGFNADDEIAIRPKRAGMAEDWHYIRSNYASMPEALDALHPHFYNRWSLAKAPEQIPAIIQPVGCRVRPVELGKKMTTAEVYEKYARQADPIKLFSFGAQVPKLAGKPLVLVVYRLPDSRFACANLRFVDRSVNVSPTLPGSIWGSEVCVLVCE